MAGAVLSRYQATPSTYGRPAAIAPPRAGAARPVTTGSTASRTGAPTSGVAGGRSVGVQANVGGFGMARPKPAQPQTAAASPGLTTQPAAGPSAWQQSQDRQRQIQADADARSAQQAQLRMQQQQMEASIRAQQTQGQGGGGGYGGFQPTPIPIAEGPAAAAPEAAPMMMLPGGGAQTERPDVGGGWGEFAARPAGPQNLGLAKGSVPMQALRATRANGGLY